MSDVNEFYTPLDQIVPELERRWNDTALRTRVREFLGEHMPVSLRDASGPSAVSVRCIATPDNEFFNFFSHAKQLGLPAVFLEYKKDKFVAKNEDKYCLAKLHFFSEKAKSFSECPSIKLINFNLWEGKRFYEIPTLWGNSLIDFHHDILKQKLQKEETPLAIEDFSDWFNDTRFKTEYYYLYYLSLFVCHGVLFENLLLSEHEREFTEQKVIPSIRKIEELFGVKPIIYPITPIEGEDDFKWWTYPADAKMVVEQEIAGLTTPS